MLDARRMEVYCAVFDQGLNLVQPSEAKIIDGHAFAPLLERSVVHFFGTGAAKCQSVITHPNAFFIDDVPCSAAGMAGPAFRQFSNGQFEDVAYFEPFYLKDFMGTKPKKAV
jgi:tRNA threonylcarbamoyladenosine biosynthesis protein TsaB